MISKRFLARLSLALVIFSVSITAYAVHSWGNYHWASKTYPFTLQTLNSTVPVTNANWPVLLAAAATQWSTPTNAYWDTYLDPDDHVAAQKLKLNVVPYSNVLKDRKRCTAVSGKIRVCNAAYGNNGWLGLASINIDSKSHITQGAAKMNDSYSSYWAKAGEAAHVMCQEVGHLFGLGHTTEDGSSQNTCMDYSTSTTSIAPNQHDYDQLAAIYNHPDGSNSYSTSAATAVTRGQSAMAGDVPLGNLVHRGHFHDVYVAPDGRGGLWVTHVRLAPGFEHLETQ